jgi:hypothetical protein
MEMLAGRGSELGHYEAKRPMTLGQVGTICVHGPVTISLKLTG